MATTILGMDLVPDIEEVLAVLRKHDAVRQQQILELIAVRHCLRARSREAALEIAQGMCKHIRHVVEQFLSDRYKEVSDGDDVCA